MNKAISSKIIVVLFSFALITGCTALQNANKTQKGAGIGAAGGAIAGGLIGGNIKGALIGAAIGGVAGGIIGNQMDKQAKKIEEELPGADVERVGEGIHVILDEDSGINFAFNSAELTAVAKQNLDKIADIFVEFPDTELMLEGHTDSTGDENYNMELSKKRANSVARYLTSHGVASGRMSVKGFGETAPRFDNATKDGQAKNRRVEFGIVANEEMIEDAQAKAN